MSDYEFDCLYHVRAYLDKLTEVEALSEEDAELLYNLTMRFYNGRKKH